MELLDAYCLGDDECTDYAWSIFADAIEKSKDPQATLHWIGWQYADLGFFADAAEALSDLCSRFDDDKARRLLAEVIWWRNNVRRIPWIPPAGDGSRYDRMMDFIDPSAPKRIPWIPPAGDGSRYDRMMDFIDPSAPKTKDEVQHARAENQKERIAPYRPSIDPQLAKLFETSIPNRNEGSSASIVDWSFLDADDGQSGETADWVKKNIQCLERWGEDDETHQEMLADMTLDAQHPASLHAEAVRPERTAIHSPD